MEAVVKECNSRKYDLYAQLVSREKHDLILNYGNTDIRIGFGGQLDDLYEELKTRFDMLIIPSDRTEMCRFAYDVFTHNIPFCHMFSGSITYSYTHDDINRWLISLMANFCFAESPEAAKNLKRIGIPEDRILVTGTSHFDGVTNYDIEASKPKDALEEHYDVVLMNPETLSENKVFGNLEVFGKNQSKIIIKQNEDARFETWTKEYPHLEFLYLLKHCDYFISNSSAIHYEVPYLNKFCGANIKVVNPSQRNKERTPIDPYWCKGASAKIAEWCENVDLEWLKKPKRYPYMPEG